MLKNTYSTLYNTFIYLTHIAISFFINHVKSQSVFQTKGSASLWTSSFLRFSKSKKLLKHGVQLKSLTVITMITLLCVSCKTKKSLTVSESSIEAFTLDQLIESIEENEIPAWINAKAKAKITDQYGSEQGKMYLKVRKDSIVWSAIKKYNYEGGRSQLTADSAFIINRLEKAWSSYSLKYLQKRYGLLPDLNYIQTVLTGISPPFESKDILDHKIDEDFIHIRVVIEGIVHDLSYDKFTGYLMEGIFKTQFDYTGSFTYDDYRLCNNGKALPFNRHYHINLNQEEFITLDLDFSNIELNIPQQIKFTIPEHYTKI